MQSQCPKVKKKKVSVTLQLASIATYRQIFQHRPTRNGQQLGTNSSLPHHCSVTPRAAHEWGAKWTQEMLALVLSAWEEDGTSCHHGHGASQAGWGWCSSGCPKGLSGASSDPSAPSPARPSDSTTSVTPLRHNLTLKLNRQGEKIPVANKQINLNLCTGQ